MTNRSILVFALAAMVSVAAQADAADRSDRQPKGTPVAQAQGHQPKVVKKAASPEQRKLRKAKRAERAQKVQIRQARRVPRATEPSRPKDYSRDFQVAAGPDSPFGTILLSESFDTGIPAGWAVVDNAGSGVVWTNLAGCGEAANWTGGVGDLACVSSDLFGIGEFDTELLTPVIDLSLFMAPATLTFNTNYANYAALDFFQVDVSTSGAAGPWTNLLSWNEDHGGFKALPGEAVNLDIASVVGQANVMFRFHYYDPNTGDWDWYAQVDDVVVEAEPTPVEPPVSVIEIPTASSYGLAGLALLLVGAGFVVLRRQH